jgi:hypothetical protein
LLLDLGEANLHIATMSRQCRDPQAKRAALSILARGLGTPGEIALLAGVSRQLVESWARSAKLDWHMPHYQRLTRAWRKAMRDEPPAQL